MVTPAVPSCCRSAIARSACWRTPQASAPSSGQQRSRRRHPARGRSYWCPAVSVCVVFAVVREGVKALVERAGRQRLSGTARDAAARGCRLGVHDSRPARHPGSRPVRQSRGATGRRSVWDVRRPHVSDRPLPVGADPLPGTSSPTPGGDSVRGSAAASNARRPPTPPGSSEARAHCHLAVHDPHRPGLRRTSVAGIPHPTRGSRTCRSARSSPSLPRTVAAPGGDAARVGTPSLAVVIAADRIQLRRRDAEQVMASGPQTVRCPAG